jgi:hypothetical protein
MPVFSNLTRVGLYTGSVRMPSYMSALILRVNSLASSVGNLPWAALDLVTSACEPCPGAGAGSTASRLTEHHRDFREESGSSSSSSS